MLGCPYILYSAGMGHFKNQSQTNFTMLHNSELLQNQLQQFGGFINSAAHHPKLVKIKHNQEYYSELKCTPKAESQTLHFHQMPHFQPEALYILPKLDTKHVSAPQVRANGLGLGNRHEDTLSDPEYIWLLYKQSTLCKLCDVSKKSQFEIS